MMNQQASSQYSMATCLRDTTPGKHQNQADAKGHAGQGYALGEKTENDKGPHGDGDLDMPGALVGIDPVFRAEGFIGQPRLANFHGVFHQG